MEGVDTYDMILVNMYYTILGLKESGLKLDEAKDIVETSVMFMVMEAVDELRIEEYMKVMNKHWYKEIKKWVVEENPPIEKIVEKIWNYC